MIFVKFAIPFYMTETVSKISAHIDDLINLGKELSVDANIEAMEKETLIWMKDSFDGAFSSAVQICKL